MKISNLKEMTKGWFIGNFEPTLLNTDMFEVAVKYYNLGDKEHRHVHKVATEFTVVAAGSVKMNNKEYRTGDIVIIPPGESTDFEALEDGTINVVVKVPCCRGDKYPM